MKYIITERQYNLIEQEEELLKLPFDAFSDWDMLQKYLNKRGNPPYELTGDVDLHWRNIGTLGSLVKVIGNLDLYNASIKSLGNLKYVSESLDLSHTLIKSIGKLKYVGGDLVLNDTPILEKYSIYEIKSMVQVGGDIY
jgi:hypothetical protein